MEYNSFNNRINRSISNLVKDAIWASVRNPSMLLFLLKNLRKQKKAAKIREANEKLEIHVPPFMIASITHKCNLKCKGCYAQARHSGINSEMDANKLEELLKEADELGISIVLLAGGEPLLRKQELFQITKKFPDTNIKEKSLKEALKSDLLKEIRQNHHLLAEEHGGCALWENRELVKSMLGK